MVSYQLLYSDCGNQTFDTIEEAKEYISNNKHKWKSHSLFSYEEGLRIAELSLIVN